MEKTQNIHFSKRNTAKHAPTGPSSPLLVPRRHHHIASPTISANVPSSNNTNSSPSSSSGITANPSSLPRSRSASRTRSFSRPRKLSNEKASLSPRLMAKSNSAASIHLLHTHSQSHSHPYNINSVINNANVDSNFLGDLILNVNLDNSLPLDYFKQDILSLVKSLRIPKWRKIDKVNYKLIHLNRISGAMTNCVYKLTYSNYYPLLLRIYGDSENIIDRDSELLTLIRLSRKNIGPKLLGCFNNGRFEEFLNNSVTLNKHQIRDQKISRMIARRMKEFHHGVELTQSEINAGPKAWLIIHKWIDVIDKIIAKEKPSIKDQKDVFFVTWDNYKKLVLKYENWLYKIYGDSDNLKKSLKFCHNDTQYGNLLFYSKSDALSMVDEDETLIDDSEISNLSLNNPDPLSVRSTSATNINSKLPLITDSNFQFDTRLTVIDFEYAGQNLPAYDITNHFSEWMYDYHDPLYSYRTNESKYPSVEERINFLNQYVNYIPGSTTPHFNPIVTNNNQRPTLKSSHSVVSIKLAELPSKVVNLYNETIYWRSASSILWSLWAIISRGRISSSPKSPIPTSNQPIFENGPNGETYKITTIANSPTSTSSSDSSQSDSDSDEEFLKPTLDDEFNHLKYTQGKNGIFIGDLIQFEIITLNEIDKDLHKNIKYLDTNLLPITSKDNS